MGSFLIGTGVTIVTFYIALIYGSIAIGLIGFAVVKALVLALDGNVGASVQDNNLKIILEL